MVFFLNDKMISKTINMNSTCVRELNKTEQINLD